MKLSVRVRGEWFAIPCKGTETTSWLASEALRRYTRAKCNGSAKVKIQIYLLATLFKVGLTYAEYNTRIIEN